jgi:hypothetical protein
MLQERAHSVYKTPAFDIDLDTKQITRIVLKPSFDILIRTSDKKEVLARLCEDFHRAGATRMALAVKEMKENLHPANGLNGCADSARIKVLPLGFAPAIAVPPGGLCACRHSQPPRQ